MKKIFGDGKVYLYLAACNVIIAVMTGIYYFVQPDGWAAQEPTVVSLVVFIVAIVMVFVNIAAWLFRKKREARDKNDE